MKSKYKDLVNVLAGIVVVFGIIGTIAVAYVFGVDIEISSYSYKTYTERNWGTTFIYLISGGLITTIEAVMMSAIGECLEFGEKLSEKLDKLNGKEEINSTDSELPPL